MKEKKQKKADKSDIPEVTRKSKHEKADKNDVPEVTKKSRHEKAKKAQSASGDEERKDERKQASSKTAEKAKTKASKKEEQSKEKASKSKQAEPKKEKETTTKLASDDKEADKSAKRKCAERQETTTKLASDDKEADKSAKRKCAERQEPEVKTKRTRSERDGEATRSSNKGTARSKSDDATRAGSKGKKVKEDKSKAKPDTRKSSKQSAVSMVSSKSGRSSCNQSSKASSPQRSKVGSGHSSCNQSSRSPSRKRAARGERRRSESRHIRRSRSRGDKHSRRRSRSRHRHASRSRSGRSHRRRQRSRSRSRRKRSRSYKARSRSGRRRSASRRQGRGDSRAKSASKQRGRERDRQREREVENASTRKNRSAERHRDDEHRDRERARDHDRDKDRHRDYECERNRGRPSDHGQKERDKGREHAKEGSQVPHQSGENIRKVEEVQTDAEEPEATRDSFGASAKGRSADDVPKKAQAEEVRFAGHQRERPREKSVPRAQAVVKCAAANDDEFSSSLPDLKAEARKVVEAHNPEKKGDEKEVDVVAKVEEVEVSSEAKVASTKQKEFAWMDSEDEAADGPNSEPEVSGRTEDKDGAKGDTNDDSEEVVVSVEALDSVQSFGRMMLFQPSLQKKLRDGTMSPEDIGAACKALARTKFFDGDMFVDLYALLQKMVQGERLNLMQAHDVLQSLKALNAYDKGVLSAIARSFKGKTSAMDPVMRASWLEIFKFFKHDHELDFLQLLDVPPLSPAHPGYRKLRCWHFSRDTCVLSGQCSYSHDQRAPLSMADACTEDWWRSKPLVMTQNQKTMGRGVYGADQKPPQAAPAGWSMAPAPTMALQAQQAMQPQVMQPQVMQPQTTQPPQLHITVPPPLSAQHLPPQLVIQPPLFEEGAASQEVAVPFSKAAAAARPPASS